MGQTRKLESEATDKAKQDMRRMPPKWSAKRAGAESVAGIMDGGIMDGGIMRQASTAAAEGPAHACMQMQSARGEKPLLEQTGERLCGTCSLNNCNSTCYAHMMTPGKYRAR